MSWFGISSKTEYAVKALCALMPYGYIAPLHRISEYVGITYSKLQPIVKKLRDGGFIRSVGGGTNGGYMIAREPMGISLYEIAVFMDGNIAAPIKTQEDMAYDFFMDAAHTQYTDTLKRVSLFDMCEKARKCKISTET